MLFVPGSVLVGDHATTLTDRARQGLDLLDTRPDGGVVVYGTTYLPPPPPPPAPQLPTVEFVTITPKTVKPPIFEFEFWFHPQPEWSQPEGRGSQLHVSVSALPFGLVEFVDDSTGQPGQIAVPQRLGPNVWQAACRLTGQDAAAAYYLRFVFYTARQVEVNGQEQTETLQVVVADSEIPPHSETLPIVEWMTKARFTFLNWDPAQKAVTAYVRMAGLQ